MVAWIQFKIPRISCCIAAAIVAATAAAAVTLRSSEMHLSCTHFATICLQFRYCCKGSCRTAAHRYGILLRKNASMRNIENYCNKQSQYHLGVFISTLIAFTPHPLDLIACAAAAPHNALWLRRFCVGRACKCNRWLQSDRTKRSRQHLDCAIVCMVATRSCYSFLLCTTKMQPITIEIGSIARAIKCATDQEL